MRAEVKAAKVDRSRSVAANAARGSGRIRRAVKGLPLDGGPRPLQCERRAGTVVDWDREHSEASFDSSRRMKTTCLQAGREDGAPHRLDLKTKDPLSGSDSGLWLSDYSTANPPTFPGGFGVPRRLLRSALRRVGVLHGGTPRQGREWSARGTGRAPRVCADDSSTWLRRRRMEDAPQAA